MERYRNTKASIFNVGVGAGSMRSGYAPRASPQAKAAGAVVDSQNSSATLNKYIEIVIAIRQTLFQFPNAGLQKLPHTVSRLNFIGELNLSHNRLTKIPAELFSSPVLRRVYLSSNLLTSLPNLSDCKSLETLDVRHNALIAVPHGIGSCRKLQAFDAERNKIREFGELVHCTSLDFLNLNRNLIKIIPAEITELTKLMYLQLRVNPVVNLPPHIYVQGMAAIMKFITDSASLSVTNNFTLHADVPSFAASNTTLTDLEVIATKEHAQPAVNYQLKHNQLDRQKVLEILQEAAAQSPVIPASTRVHSLFLLARLPTLREEINKALKMEKPILSLPITPTEMHVLLKFVQSDTFDRPPPPTQEHVAELAQQRLNAVEVEALRSSLVHEWRTSILAVASMAKVYHQHYLVTLTSQALGGVATADAPFAPSSFAQDFAAMLPKSTISHEAHAEWDENAMKHIMDGFSELSLHKDLSPESALRSSKGLNMAAPSQSNVNSTDPTKGVKSPSFAPNDVAFRVTEDPTAPIIGAHKIMLCSRSKYLESMLTGGLLESQQKIVDMADISYDTLKAIVEFCYTDDITDLHGEMVIELLMKARLFGLDRLLAYVESIIGYSLDVYNVSGILGVAHTYQLPRLVKATKFFVITNWSSVTSDPSWQEVLEPIRNKLTDTAIKWGVIQAPAQESHKSSAVIESAPRPSEEAKN